MILLYHCFSGLAIPMSSSSCSPSEVKKVEPKSKLELTCASTCDHDTAKSLPTFEWMKVSTGNEGDEEKTEVLESTSQRMVIKSVKYADGGIYRCRCSPNGPQCKQTVYGNHTRTSIMGH